MLTPNENTEKNPLQRSADYIKSLFTRCEEAKNNPETPQRVDSKGRIYPASIISAVDAARDDLVNEMVILWKQERVHLSDIKATAFANIEEFLAYSLANYEVKMGGKKSGVTLTNFSQTSKIVISYAERITFTEELMAAKTLIEELIEEKSEGVDDITKTLLMNAFSLNDGNINTAEILKLRRINIVHPKWEQAMLAISKAILPIGSKGYVRVYVRENIDSEWEAISLDIATL
jgi:hypothetical protein